MKNLEIHIGTSFSDKPAALNERPKANGFFSLTQAELTKYAGVSLHSLHSQQQLLTDYRKLSPAARTGTPGGRNLARRIGHLGGST